MEDKQLQLLSSFGTLSSEAQKAFLQEILAKYPAHASILNEQSTEKSTAEVLESPIQLIPEEVLLQIFQVLPDVVDILHISLVCKQWSKLSRDKRYFRCLLTLEAHLLHPSLHLWERLLKLEGWRIEVSSGGGSSASMSHLLDWHKIGRFCAAEQAKCMYYIPSTNLGLPIP